MSIYGLLASLLWAAVAVLFIARLNTFAHRWLSVSDPVAQSKASLPAQVPPDLESFALQESEKWAQDSVMETIRERFDKLGDWNKVRQALGVGTVD